MKTRSAALLGSLFASLLPSPAAAQYGPEWYGPGWHMGWGGGWGFGWMFPLLFLIVIVFLVVFVFSSRSGGHRHWGAGGGDPTFSALQILNERFARGEIQKQEYEEKKAAILSGSRR